MSELTVDYKIRIVEAIENNAFKFKTNKAQAVSIGVNPAIFSRIMNKDLDNVLSDSKWKEIASKYNVPLESDGFMWQTAYTTVYDYISKQLEACQQLSISGIFCDIADIGKSHTAKDYVSRHRNAIRVDCSLNKSRTALLRAMAKEFGIDHHSPIRILQKDLIQYINAMTKPLVILDEFGDLSYEAYLEVKALWNGTENRCGWYGMGADGLAVKFDRKRDLKIVGFAENWSRFGSKYQRITPPDEAARKKFLMHEISKILKANNSKYTPLQMYAMTDGSLRRVYNKIIIEKSGVLEQVSA